MSRKSTLLGVGGCLLLALTFFLWGGVAASIAGRLLFGWFFYLVRVLPLVTVSWDGVVTAMGGLVLFTLGLHAFLRWLYREIRLQQQATSAEHPAPYWPLRRTISLVVVVIVMFVAGIAASGVVHQAGWLLSTKDAWASVRRATWRLQFSWDSPSNLRETGLSVAWYTSSHQTLPSTRYDARQTRAIQSWQAVLLPYVHHGSRTAGLIDYDQPWDAPRNAAYFRGIVPPYLNPEITPIRSPEGFALSHYAGNRHVLGARQPLRIPEASQGQAHLIVAGEVAQGFKPWGDPSNLRDPIRGLRGTAEEFGNPSMTGANFLFGDGSVRFLKRTTSPQVLTRHSLPGPD